MSTNGQQISIRQAGEKICVCHAADMALNLAPSPSLSSTLARCLACTLSSSSLTHLRHKMLPLPLQHVALIYCG